MLAIYKWADETVRVIDKSNDTTFIIHSSLVVNGKVTEGIARVNSKKLTKAKIRKFAGDNRGCLYGYVITPYIRNEYCKETPEDMPELLGRADNWLGVKIICRLWLDNLRVHGNLLAITRGKLIVDGREISMCDYVIDNGCGFEYETGECGEYKSAKAYLRETLIDTKTRRIGKVSMPDSTKWLLDNVLEEIMREDDDGAGYTD